MESFLKDFMEFYNNMKFHKKGNLYYRLNNDVLQIMEFNFLKRGVYVEVYLEYGICPLCIEFINDELSSYCRFSIDDFVLDQKQFLFNPSCSGDMKRCLYRVKKQFDKWVVPFFNGDDSMPYVHAIKKYVKQRDEARKKLNKEEKIKNRFWYRHFGCENFEHSFEQMYLSDMEALTDVMMYMSLKNHDKETLRQMLMVSLHDKINTLNFSLEAMLCQSQKRQDDIDSIKGIIDREIHLIEDLLFKSEQEIDDIIRENEKKNYMLLKKKYPKLED